MSVTLMYLSSDYIVSYIAENPINWHNKELARRRGPGDMAGVTPTPAIKEFLELLSQRQSLFTQTDYANYCQERWAEWLNTKPEIQKTGVVAKLFRNFYPSMIDSLHVWSMLSEVGWFDICFLDAYEDAIGKTDLTLKSGDETTKLAILGPTNMAREDRDYKLIHRNNGYGVDAIEIQLSFSRPRYPGNKRWFKLADFEELNTNSIQLGMPL